MMARLRYARTPKSQAIRELHSAETKAAMPSIVCALCVCMRVRVRVCVYVHVCA